MTMQSVTFEQLITFTRTSAATYVNSAGNVVQTPASKNLLLWTEVFSDAAWGKDNVSVTGNTAVAPDGRSTADTLTASGTSLDGLFGNIATTAAAHTFSLYMKQGNTAASEIGIIDQGTVANRVRLTYATGAVTVVAGTATGSATDVGNGWWRVQITYTFPASGAADSFAILPGAGGSTSGDFCYIWGAQVELGSTATSYVKNDGGLFPARFDYDPATLAPKGLLIESQRTNLLLRSEEFDNASWGKNAPVSITANYAVSPDGTADADRFVSSGGASPQVAQWVTLTAGQPYTFSVWVKSDGTSQVQQTMLLDGSQTNFTPTATWTRVSVTVASSTGGSKAAVIATDSPSAAASSFLVWGAQIEAGSYATSYIPTAGSQVTRTADVASIVAPNFASWYNQSEGTFVVEFDTAAATVGGANKGLASANDGTGNNRNYGYIAANGTPGILVSNGGIAEANSFNSLISNNTIAKTAWAYKVNDFAVVTDGGVVATDLAGTPPSALNTLNIGHHLAGQQLDGHIRSVKYFPSRLSDAQLQALSA